MTPPQHSLDARPVYILSTDPAWNWDLIKQEKSEAEDEEVHPTDHYFAGNTRYDLRAPLKWQGVERSMTEYLEGTPVKIHLRRLRVSQMAVVSDMLIEAHRDTGEDNEDSAAPTTIVWEECVQHGIIKIEGSDHVDERASGSDMERAIYDYHGGMLAIMGVGTAIWNLSRPMSDAEKKA